MTNKELNEVANKVWNSFTDQMPEDFNGRDLLKIAASFVVNTANALDMKPTDVCMMMYNTLNKEEFKKTEGYQYSYSDEWKDANSTSHLQIEGDKLKAPTETKCFVCQEHHHILGLTHAFDLRIREDILTLTDKTVHSDMRFPKDVFKIKYCPFCGRKL